MSDDLNPFYSIDDILRRKLADIAESHANVIAQLTGNSSVAERDTWPVKEAAALDVKNGGDGGGVLIPVKGETLLQLAEKTLAKATAFKTLVGKAENAKRTAEKAAKKAAASSGDFDSVIAAINAVTFNIPEDA